MRKVLFVCLMMSAAAAATGCGGGKKLGIASCDQFIEKERACGDKIGGDQGKGLSKQADMMYDAWSKDKDDKDAAGSLDATCKEALGDAAKHLPQCDWK
jgi:hypothetical protein